MFDLMHLVQHYALPFIVVISIVVFVHEFGHYWIARRNGVRILTFSIGFGPEIFGWDDKHGTHWQVSWLPLGGYVKMFGDADPASTPDESVHDMTEEEKKVAFFHQSVGRRLAIVVAGPAFNYLFSILVFALIFMISGQPYSPADVSEIVAKSPAERAGFMVGDHIVAIDGSPVNRFEDVKRLVALNTGTPIAVDVDRKGQLLHIDVTPEIVTITDRFGGEDRVGRIGIGTDALAYKKRGPAQALEQSVVETWDMTTMSLRAMGQMIKGTRSTDELRGPLGIAEMSGKITKDESFVSFFMFLGLISVNLGLINLFPIPLLDGGHFAFYTVEWLRGGRPLSQRIQEAGSRVGVALVLSLMVFATWNDLVHLKVVAYVRSLFS